MPLNRLTQKLGQKRSRGEWRGLMVEYGGSGLSKVAFCKLKRINKNSFYKWCSILATESQNTIASKFIPIRVIDSKESAAGSAANHVIRTKDNSVIKSSLQIRVRDGLRLEFNNGCKISELKAVIGVLNVI